MSVIMPDVVRLVSMAARRLLGLIVGNDFNADRRNERLRNAAKKYETDRQTDSLENSYTAAPVRATSP